MRKVFLALVLLLAPLASAREKFTWYCMDGNQTLTTGGVSSDEKAMRSFPSCSITIYDAGTSNLSTIYSDSAGTPKANPFTATATGLVEFFADNALYDVRFSAGGISTPFTLSSIRLNDPAALGLTVQAVTYSATPTFNAANGGAFKITLTGNVTGSTLSNPVAGQILTFIICQDGVGSRTFAWPANVTGPLTIDATASACTTQTFMYDAVSATARAYMTYISSAAVANQFLTGITSAGVITRAQPASTDLSDTANLVRNNAANTYTTGAQDFGSASSLKVPTSAGAAPTANGLVAYDSTANALEYGDNGTNRTVANTDEAQTLTNKTVECESGNTCTITSKLWFRGGLCNNATASTAWDLPTSNPAVATCVTGTNTQKAVLAFADGASTLSGQYLYALPTDFTGTIDATFKWYTSATAGDVVWQLATICVADGETDDPAFNTASTVTDTAKGTTNQLNDASITGVTITGCAAGEVLHLKVSRDPTTGADTLAATANLLGIELTMRRQI